MLPVRNTQKLLLFQNVAAQQFDRLMATQVNLKVAEDTQTLLPFSEIPGPKYFEALRSFLPGGQFHDKSLPYFAKALREKYGNIVLMPGMFGRPDSVYVYSTEDFEKIFRNEGQWPQRQGFESTDHFRKKIKGDFFQDTVGLVVAQGEPWFKLRSLVNPVLMQPRATKPYIKPLFHVNQEFVKAIKHIRDPNTMEVPKDFEEYINRLSFESLALVALNKNLGLLRQTNLDPEILKYFSNVRRFLQLVYHLDVEPSMWKIIGTPRYYESMKVQTELFDTTQKYVNETIKELEEKEKSGVQTENLGILEKMLKINRKMAIVMAMDMLLAGVDTTSATLMAIMLCLAKNPEKQEKLRTEILNIMPTKDTELSEDNMKQLPYLRAVIKESLRYYPNSTGTFRNTSVDGSLSGYHIPKGTFVFINSNLLMKDERYYTRPQEFLPERWLRDGDKRKIDVNPFTFMPFGFGPRSCIGKRLVDAELEVSIATLLRNFKIEFNHPSDEPFRTYFVNTPQIPMQFKFSDLEV